jgi:hypothetical protein
MIKTIPPTFSAKKLEFHIPDCWEKLSQQQLRYVCYALANYEGQSAKVYILVRLLGLEVQYETEKGWYCKTKLASGDRITFTLPTWQIMSFLKVVDFVDVPAHVPVCLFHIGKLTAVDPLFHGVSFSEYLQIENLFQGYLFRNDDELLARMALFMYIDKSGGHPSSYKFKKEELVSIFQWYYSLKTRFAKEFSHFFERIDEDGEQSEEVPNMIEIMNNEIRALTGGDITKENTVLTMDCWRALTELNEKAREAKELKKKYGRN